VHGNWEALQAVLDDIELHGAERIVCLGDSVGYGPESARCFDLLARRSAVLLAGNHEWGLQRDNADGFLEEAAGALEVAKEQFESRGSEAAIRKRLATLEAIDHLHEEGDVLYVHGSPADPLWGYVFPSYVDDEWDREQVKTLFEKMKWVCFCGHSHCPCVISDDLRCWWPEGDDVRRVLDRGRKHIVNVGSVGQPRDGDPRACYVLFRDNEVTFRRVPYALSRTQEKISRTAGLSSELAARLEAGE
jgi:diadenosine tetraphosphatase ApaH/serine/threonine PP2A family protein phosphatase